jgi:GTP cyclohydrolase IB
LVDKSDESSAYLGALQQKIGFTCNLLCLQKDSSKLLMKSTDSFSMPDAQNTQGNFGSINWVGMSNVALRLRIDTQDVASLADVHVDLNNASARGIHMSRLYALLDQLGGEALCPQIVVHALQECVASQSGLSSKARLRLKFSWQRRAPALVSALSGWRSYPVSIEASVDAHASSFHLSVELAYSSTCPSSAALARQVLQLRFAEQFKDVTKADKADVEAWLLSQAGGSAATAHAQRSLMQIQVPLRISSAHLPIELLVSQLEQALQTPVQTAVKRVDEQSFAERNGANLMFVEDALRRAKTALLALGFESATVRAQHLESLHAHDATGELSW